MKQTIYLDNAATTALDPRVLDEMMPYFTAAYGNASSIHGMGRKAKVAIENARKQIASLLNTSPAEIFFTSGGTEANNTVLRSSVGSLGAVRVITSPLEHHAVLHPLEYMEKHGQLELAKVKLAERGSIDLSHLEELLDEGKKTLVCLMHGNNEIGNLLDLEKVSTLCRSHGAYFHSDTVQTMGKYPIDLQETDIDFLSGSAHKFHGPKGVGFLYINAKNKIGPLLYGGAQERNMRGGTENVPAIVGLAKAMQLAIDVQAERKGKILDLKAYMKTKLLEDIPGVEFNGMSGDLKHSLYNILNVRFPSHPDNEMLLFNLDIEGICASGGSACSSGTDIGSHVLQALNLGSERANVRFSFCSQNTTEEIDQTLAVLKAVFVQ